MDMDENLEAIFFIVSCVLLFIFICFSISTAFVLGCKWIEYLKG